MSMYYGSAVDREYLEPDSPYWRFTVRPTPPPRPTLPMVLDPNVIDPACDHFLAIRNSLGVSQVFLVAHLDAKPIIQFPAAFSCWGKACLATDAVAAAMLLRALAPDAAWLPVDLAERFTREVLSQIPLERWAVSVADVRRWARETMAELAPESHP